MTMEEAHKELLRLLREAFEDLLEVHTDKTYLNCDAPHYTAKVATFNRIQERIFAFKDTWDEVTRE